MLPSNFRTLLAEVVTHRRREHHTEVDKAIREFSYKMARQGIIRSSAFNDGSVRIYCEAFEKHAASVWEDMQRVLEGGFGVYPGCEDDLINFLKESLAVVCEADAKSLFDQKNVAVHKVISTHLAQCKPRFEFRCRAVTEKLITEVKIFANQLRARKEMAVNEAVIEGRKCQLTGFDAEGNLVLADGQRYIFERLNFNPPGKPPDEPAGDIFGWPLLEVVKLQQWQGDWKWNNEPLPLRKWMESELQKLVTKRAIPQQHRTDPAQIKALLRSKADDLHPSYATRAFLHSRLQHLPPAVQALINGVAWFKHDDGADGWNTSILLKSFRPLPLSAKPTRSKTTRRRQPKPVARFENDFSLAIIPQKGEDEDILSLGLELQTMVREIVRANGRLAGPKLIAKLKVALKRESNIRPDRWFQSPVAVQLRKAGLLGKTGFQGRIVVYLAKEKTT